MYYFSERYRSSSLSHPTPVVKFGFQEPCNDPQSFCYLWVLHESRGENTCLPFAVMYGILYKKVITMQEYGRCYKVCNFSIEKQYFCGLVIFIIFFCRILCTARRDSIWTLTWNVRWTVVASQAASYPIHRVICSDISTRTVIYRIFHAIELFRYFIHRLHFRRRPIKNQPFRYGIWNLGKRIWYEQPHQFGCFRYEPVV